MSERFPFRWANRAGRAVALLLLITLLSSLLPPPPLVSSAPVEQARPERDAKRSYELQVSPNADRSRSTRLVDKGVVSGDVHAFVTPPAGIDRVRFLLDPSEEQLQDPRMAINPRETDDKPPFDFGGTGAKGEARALDTRQLSDGPHTIAAALDLKDGTTEVLYAHFLVHNGPPALLFGWEPAEFRVPAGGRMSKTVKLFTSNDKNAGFTLSENASWLSIEGPTPLSNGKKGFAPGLRTLEVDARGLAPGRYTETVTVSGSGYSSGSLTVTMEVTATATCEPPGSPIPCPSEILVDLPYELDFDEDRAKIPDANGVGTGFTYLDQPSKGTGYIPQNLVVDRNPPGTLAITTTKGIMSATANSQDNAVGVGIDAPSQITVMETTLLNPPAGSGNFEQAGLWFGNDENNYLKTDVISTTGGTIIEYLLEVAGKHVARKATGPLTLSGATVTLSLRANPGDQKISAFYSINGGAFTQVASFSPPPEFFSFDAAGIDPTIGTRSFGGVYATHRNGATPLVYTFDSFSVTAGAAAPPSGVISFDRSSFPVPFPTSMVWGPDNRLYVTELFGKIHAITLNDAKQLVARQEITSLGTRLTLGITVDPSSTAENVVLWAAHSSPSTDAGELNSSTITRLSGPGFATREDVITGLPRAYANHAVNSLHFGPDGKLYIAVGGNTGAGAPNEASTEFGTRAEQPLSAAVLVADVYATGFDGSCATPEHAYAPSPCDVQVYSSGLRNMYDFVWHSNGFLYGPDNGLGVTGTYPPSPTAPCEGYGDPTSYTQGGDNPGEQPDILVRLEQGKYYGHPNPYRNECVFKDGFYQGVAPLASYVSPIYVLGNHKSADGAIEYRADSFAGALQGELLIANYSVGNDITRVRLSPDGLSVIEAKQLVGGFNNPLPLTEGPDGTIYVGEFGGGLVTALIPKAIGTWTAKHPLPVEVLDVGGAAVGGKMYVVAGKTSGGGPQSAMYIYDPATNGWAAGQSLPSEYPAVENPAVVAYNGKLYSFGGSTLPFSGAVDNSAVFDPVTSSWTSLAPMPTARGGAIAQAIGGKIYVAGGMDGSGASVASLEVYDPATNSWSTAASMGTRRDNPGSAALNGLLYLFGGRTRNLDGTETPGTLATVEAYDPATNSWSPRTSMPTGRRTMMVGTLDGKAQVMGGEKTPSGGAFQQNEEYDPITDSWRTLTPMPTPRHGGAAATIDGVVYVAGGGVVGGSSFSSAHEAFSFVASGTAPDTTAPTVTNVAPLDGATDVAVGSNVEGVFSEAIDPATLTTTTFTLVKQGTTTPVAATVTYDSASRKAVLNPDASLEFGTVYTATLKGGTGGIADSAGNVLAVDMVWSFTTGTAPDTTAPTVTSVAPLDGATDVAVGTNVEGVFSEAIDPATLSTTTFTLVKQGETTPVAAAVTYDSANTKAILNPDADVEFGTVYTATLKGGTGGIADSAGNVLAVDMVWSFTTGTAPDTTAPTVTSVAPLDGATDVAVGTNVEGVFSEAIDPATLTTTTFTLVKQGTTTPVAAAVTYDSANMKAVLNPNADLEFSTVYTATLKGGTGGIADVAGNVLAADMVWSFTTAAQTATYSLLVSTSPDRANPVPLEGRTVIGSIYVFTSPDTPGIKRVRFFLDDPNRTGKPRTVENNAPYDFMNGTVTTAKPFDTKKVANGSHTITAEVIMESGQVHVVNATFVVSN